MVEAASAGPTRAFEPAVPLPPVPGLAFRHYAGPADYPGMNAAANASRRADGASTVTSDEQLANFYEHLSNSDRERDLLIAEVQGRIVGYGRAAWFDAGEERVFETVGFLDPAWRRRGIGTAMLAAIEGRLLELNRELEPRARTFQAVAEDKADGAKALLVGSGYHAVRYYYEMVRPTLDDEPDCPLPTGLEIREVRPEHMRAIWDAANEAFADEWDHHAPTEEEFERFRTDPVQGDTSLWRIAWDGDVVAGQVRGFINAEENRQLGRRRGWVESIAVRRPWRRRGLARALIAATISLLRARGMVEGALTVDTDNPSGALRLYESVGFRPVSRSVVYRKPVADLT